MDDRYSRQTLFRPIGITGQKKLQDAHVLIVGCGALGSGIAETLVRAGVGTLTLIDRDYVEYSNLQRQQLFTEEDARQQLPKVVAAERHLKRIRSDVQLYTYFDHADSSLLQQLAADIDLLMDATDNFETRLLINDMAWKKQIPWIYGACVGSHATTYPFVPGKSPCFRCLIPVLPAVNETCDTVGIIAPTVQLVVAFQCAEALKWLTGQHQMMRQQLLHLDCWHNEMIAVNMHRLQKKNCPTCGNQPTFPSLQPQQGATFAVLCGRETVQIIPERSRSITLEQAERVLERARIAYRQTPFFLEFTIASNRCVIFKNGRIFIHGLRDIEVGRTIYHQLFG